MRQLGSVPGIAVMGAVVPNRVVVYGQTKVSATLNALPFIPAEMKAAIVDAVGTTASHLGEMRSGGAGDLAAMLPPELRDTLSQVRAHALEDFENLFTRELFMGDFVHAMRTTILMAILVLLSGAVLALLIRSHVREAEKTAAAVEGGT